MREIGGYFGLEVFGGREYYHDLIGVNSGRNALLYILKVRKIRKLYIPRFLCDSVSALCCREGYEYEEYEINTDFMPIFDRSLMPGEALYIVNYYGQISNEQVIKLKERWGNIIFDNVQAFFQRPVPGIDTVYSCRKFFGVPDGGYVATDSVLVERLPIDESKERMKHVLGRFEGKASDYYGDFQENDEKFYDLPLRSMSLLTQNIMRGINYEFVRTQRNANYAILDSMLGKRNKLHLLSPDGPYCYPLYCEDGMEMKRCLAAQKIFVPTLWPNCRLLDGTLEKELAENILPLPCDQRYGPMEMRMIVEGIYNV